jgi:hypothetical protein
LIHAYVIPDAFSKSGDVQGNCGSNSNMSVLEDLEVSTAGRVEYPPLKPFQCALVIDKPFLLVMNGTLWLDSLYVAVARTKVQSKFAILSEGQHILEYSIGRHLYITSLTFVGDGRGSARAIFSNESNTYALIEGAADFRLAHAFTNTSLAVRRYQITYLCGTIINQSVRPSLCCRLPLLQA